MAGPRFLLDTSVYSQPLKKQPDRTATGHWSAVGDDACAVSIVTCAEVEWGSPQGGHSPLVDALRTGAQAPPPRSAHRCRRLVRIRPHEGRATRPWPPHRRLRSLIGATAVTHGFTLATHNLDHFRAIQGLVVTDWSRP